MMSRTTTITIATLTEADKIRADIAQNKANIKALLNLAKLKYPEINVDAYMDANEKEMECLLQFWKKYSELTLNDKDNIFSMTDPPLRVRTLREQAQFEELTELLTNIFVAPIRKTQILQCKPRESWATWMKSSGYNRPLGQPYMTTKAIVKFFIRNIETEAYTFSQEWLDTADTLEDEEEDEPEHQGTAFIGANDKQPRKRKRHPKTIDGFNMAFHNNRTKHIEFLRTQINNLVPLSQFKENWPIVKEELLLSLDRFEKGELNSEDYECYTGIERKIFEAAGIPSNPRASEDKDALFFKNLFFGGNDSPRSHRRNSNPPPKKKGGLKFTCSEFFKFTSVLLGIGIGISVVALAYMYADSAFVETIRNLTMNAYDTQIKPKLEELAKQGEEIQKGFTVVYTKLNNFLGSKLKPIPLEEAEKIQMVQTTENAVFQMTANQTDFTAGLCNAMAQTQPCAAFQGLSEEFKLFDFISYVILDGNYTADIWKDKPRILKLYNDFNTAGKQAIYHIDANKYWVNVNATYTSGPKIGTKIYKGFDDPVYQEQLREKHRNLNDKAKEIMSAYTSGKSGSELYNALKGIIALTSEDKTFLEKIAKDYGNQLNSLTNFMQKFSNQTATLEQFIKNQIPADIAKDLLRVGNVNSAEVMINRAMIHIMTPASANEKQRKEIAGMVHVFVTSTLGQKLLQAKQMNNLMKLMPALLTGSKIVGYGLTSLLLLDMCRSWASGEAVGLLSTVMAMYSLGNTVVNVWDWMVTDHKQETKEKRTEFKEKLKAEAGPISLEQRRTEYEALAKYLNPFIKKYDRTLTAQKNWPIQYNTYRNAWKQNIPSNVIDSFEKIIREHFPTFDLEKGDGIPFYIIDDRIKILNERIIHLEGKQAIENIIETNQAQEEEQAQDKPSRWQTAGQLFRKSWSIMGQTIRIGSALSPIISPIWSAFTDPGMTVTVMLHSFMEVFITLGTCGFFAYIAITAWHTVKGTKANIFGISTEKDAAKVGTYVATEYMTFTHFYHWLTQFMNSGWFMMTTIGFPALWYMLSWKNGLMIIAGDFEKLTDGISTIMTTNTSTGVPVDFPVCSIGDICNESGSGILHTMTEYNKEASPYQAVEDFKLFNLIHNQLNSTLATNTTGMSPQALRFLDPGPLEFKFVKSLVKS